MVSVINYCSLASLYASTDWGEIHKFIIGHVELIAGDNKYWSEEKVSL